MNDEEKKLKEQLNFIDYIYPDLSRRLNDLQRESDNIVRHMFDVDSQIKNQNRIIEQYKKKIQRIEQFLIKHGFIKLLSKEKS